MSSGYPGDMTYPPTSEQQQTHTANVSVPMATPHAPTVGQSHVVRHDLPTATPAALATLTPPTPREVVTPTLAATPTTHTPTSPTIHDVATPQPTSVTSASGGDNDGDDIEATLFVPKPGQWVLALEDGRVIDLPSADVVIGRAPRHDTATPVKISDDTRTLSATHARLRWSHDTATWFIEDLGSTNGVALVDSNGRHRTLVPQSPTRATEYLLLGTLRAHLVRRPNSQ
jgi:hypothetical protein